MGEEGGGTWGDLGLMGGGGAGRSGAGLTGGGLSGGGGAVRSGAGLVGAGGAGRSGAGLAPSRLRMLPSGGDGGGDGGGVSGITMGVGELLGLAGGEGSGLSGASGSGGLEGRNGDTHLARLRGDSSVSSSSPPSLVLFWLRLTLCPLKLSGADTVPSVWYT